MLLKVWKPRKKGIENPKNVIVVELAIPGFMSFNNTVPPTVPSVFHISPPFEASLAVNKTAGYYNISALAIQNNGKIIVAANGILLRYN